MDQVTIAVERVGDRRRWVRVTMSLHSNHPADRFLSYRDPFAWNLEPADRMSAAYGWHDWEEVVREAIEYVWRPFGGGGVTIAEVQGVLGLEDREGLALACALAVRRLVGEVVSDWEDREWRERSSR